MQVTTEYTDRLTDWRAHSADSYQFREKKTPRQQCGQLRVGKGYLMVTVGQQG